MFVFRFKNNKIASVYFSLLCSSDDAHEWLQFSLHKFFFNFFLSFFDFIFSVYCTMTFKLLHNVLNCYIDIILLPVGNALHNLFISNCKI